MIRFKQFLLCMCLLISLPGYGQENCERGAYAVTALSHGVALVGECSFPSEIEKDLRGLFGMEDTCALTGVVCESVSVALTNYLAGRVPERYGCRLNVAKLLSRRGFATVCNLLLGDK